MPLLDLMELNERDRHAVTHARLAALITSSVDAIAVTTREGILTDWNPAAERLFGYTAQEAIGQPLALLTPPHLALGSAQVLTRLCQGDSIEGFETVCQAKNGRLLDVSLTLSPIRTDAGQLLACSAIIRDITERKAAEHAVATAHRRTRQVLESTTDGVLLLDRDWRIIELNPAAEGLFGTTRDEMRGRRICQEAMPVLTTPLFAALTEAMAARHPAIAEGYYPPVDRWLELRAYPAPDGLSVFLRDITDRKRTEAALQESEARFRAAFENASVGMLLTAPDERPLQVNQALCNMLGYTVSELGEMTLEAITHPDDGYLSHADLIQASSEESITYEREKRYVRKDGRIIWALLSGALVRDEVGAPRYYVSLIHDITERKTAEAEFARLTAELQASEAKFRTLVEQLPAAVYLLATKEANETPLYFSPSIMAVTGETPAEAMVSHQHWLDLVHPEDRARVAAEDERSGARADAFHAEYRHRRQDGSYVWVQDEYVPIKDETGQVVAWLGILLDITERIQAEDAQSRLAAIVASAEDAIISSTREGTITSWNEGAERLFGFRAAEMIGQSFTLLLPDDVRDPTRERRRAALAGESVPPFETTCRRREGTTFAASLALSPIRDRDGQISGISSITRDMTERKQLERELRAAVEAAQAANQAKSYFLAMMSHELRTPLQAILGYTEVLLAAPAGAFSAEQQEDLGYIEQGGRRMLTLINQLLDLSRIEADRLQVVRNPVDLAPILEQVRQDVAPQANRKGLALGLDLPEGVPRVMGDAERLRQILLNLVGNAVKFTEQGSVAVTAAVTDEATVVVRVRDTGMGIAPEAVPHIFEMFKQVDSRLARRHGGAGLGLAIAQKLAQLMGGQITVESTLGVGSTFTLQVPAAAATPR
jgi:PAS domain S-box-containing protein